MHYYGTNETCTDVACLSLECKRSIYRDLTISLSQRLVEHDQSAPLCCRSIELRESCASGPLRLVQANQSPHKRQPRCCTTLTKPTNPSPPKL